MGFMGALGKIGKGFVENMVKGGGRSSENGATENGSAKLGVKGMLGKAFNFAKGVYNHPITQKLASDGYNHFKNHEKYGGLARAAGQFHKDKNIFAGIDNLSKGIHQAKTGERAKMTNPNRGIKRPAEKAFRDVQGSMKGQRPPPSNSRMQRRY